MSQPARQCPWPETAQAVYRPYDLVILDFDGVLADSAPWMLANLGEVCAGHGLARPAPSEMERLRHLPNRQIIKAMGIPLWKLPAIARDLRQRVARDAASIPLYPGASDLIDRLHGAGIPMAIVSSNAEANIRAILGKESAAMIGTYACGASLFGKPALFRKVLKSLPVPEARVLCIGDETRDIEAAKKAGLACAAVTWGYARKAPLEAARPDYLIEDFDSLIRLLIP